MAVPLLDLKVHHDPIRKEILSAIERTLDDSHFILGPDVKELEERVALYSQTQFAVGVSSGTDALLISLMGLDIGAGDEVITTPLSFFATAGCICRLGAKPVFVDIDPVTYNLDANKIEPVLSSKTKAIIPVHLYGQCADVDRLNEVARQSGVAVVEDAAQAIGAEFRDGTRAGSKGTVGCFSFFPSKNLGALGDGGMVVTNDSALNEKLRVLRVQGGKPKYYHKMIGGNFRLDTMQAAVLNVKLSYLDQWTTQRQENADHYTALFTQSQLVQNGKISLPHPVYKEAGVNHYHIYNQYVIRAPGHRDSLRAYLKERGIGTEIYYPVPFHMQECLQYLGYREGDFPEAEHACQETLALPIFPELQSPQREEVVKAIEEYFSQ